MKSYLITTAAVLTALTVFSTPSIFASCYEAKVPACETVNNWYWQQSFR
jgi:hypothetical protein